MAEQLLTLLDDAALDLTPEPPEFEALAAQHLAGLENVEGAIDMDLLDVAAAVNDAPLVLAGMDSDELGMIAELPHLQTEHEAPVAAEMADAQAEGDAAVGEFESDSQPST
jgi:hypothetical protein